jgi:glycosyltransferase involved in cell wall biosynthesis
MNILVITPWFPDHPDDQHGNFVLDSVESLCALGHRVHVLVTRPYVPLFWMDSKQRGYKAINSEMFSRGFSLECQQYLSIPRNHLRRISNWLYLTGCAGATRRAIIENAIDVVHAHTEITGYLACYVSDVVKLPVVTTLHGVNRDRRFLSGAGQKKFFRSTFTYSDRLVLVGATLLDFVAKYIYSLDHVRVVQNGFRDKGAAPFRSRRVLDTSPIVKIVSVSNLVEGKGIDVNLDSLGHPEIARIQNWHYHVVGDGPLLSRLQAQAQALNIADRVTFHGRCGHGAVYKLLSTCDIFSLPSAPEAFGIAYLEAMACGLLSIGVVGQGPSSFMEHYRTGILIREGDHVGLSVYLLDIFNNPAKYVDIAAAGSEHVWQNYTWRAHALAMTTVFQEALKSQTRSFRIPKVS